MKFECKYSRDGVIRASFTVPAVEAALYGVYMDGVPYKPDQAAIAKAMPYPYRMAAARGNLWHTGMSDVFRLDLVSVRGKPLGSVFCKVIGDDD